MEKNIKDYFAEPTYRTESYSELIKPSRFDKMTGGQTEPYTIQKEREVVDGYKLNAKYPFAQILIKIDSLFPNIKSYNCTIAFITSDRKIKLYYFITNYENENWKDKTLNSRFEWNASEILLIEKEKILSFIKSLNDNINSRIINDLKRQFENVKEE